jgi:hypothetical protein
MACWMAVRRSEFIEAGQAGAVTVGARSDVVTRFSSGPASHQGRAGLPSP